MGQFLLGMCHWPLRTPTPLQSILWPIIDPILVTFEQMSYDDAKGRRRIGGGINVPVNATLKANKSQAKEIKRLPIQKKIQVVLTSMEDNNAE